MPDPLHAVSPLDGRYARYTEPLRPYASEAALMRARVEVEVEYLLALADLDATPLSIGADDRQTLRTLYADFDDDAAVVKRLETEGYGNYAATNHDVKAVEYFLRLRLPEGLDADQWLHFALTSEDVNNLAHRLLLDRGVTEVGLPALVDVRDTLVAMAHEHADTPMLARTHGQPATPTTFGKEMAVYASRLARAVGRIEAATDDLSGKLAGASGVYAAHHAAYPGVDWPAFARSFVTGLGLEHEPLTTQVNPCDDLAALFDALRSANNVLIDLDRDAWLYVSDRYLGQEAVDGQTGSSTMPHKVNPIDFENSEGNLSDSTVKRNIGGALAHCLIGYRKCSTGLQTVVPNEQVMRDDLEANPAVVGEAVQTILRREGHADAYERVKELTRGERVDLGAFRDLFADLDVDDSVEEELRALTPAGYTGVASDLAGDVE